MTYTAELDVFSTPLYQPSTQYGNTHHQYHHRHQQPRINTHNGYEREHHTRSPPPRESNSPVPMQIEDAATELAALRKRMRALEKLVEHHGTF